MKNWKQYGIKSFFIILLLVLNFIGCEKENSCNCITKEHLGIDENCCGGYDCNCSEQINTLIETDIKIRKQKGISIDQMNIAIDKINGAYIIVSESRKETFISKVTEIQVTSGSNTHLIGSIWYVGYNVDSDQIKDNILGDVIIGWH